MNTNRRDESEDDHKLRDSYGRGMNTLSEDYKFPADRAEMERLSIQHRMWKLLVGGLYPLVIKTTVDRALEEPRPMIMDVGCGSANWPIEMAELYPNAQVIGVDLALNFHKKPPSNFQFIQMDISGGLPACNKPGGYDLIHARSLTEHLQDPAGFIQRAHDALKPGGLFMLAATSAVIFGRDQVMVPSRFPEHGQNRDDSEGSWFAGWQELCLQIVGKNWKPADDLLAQSPFSSVFSKRYFCPVGWDGGDIENGAELGDIMHKNLQQFIPTTLPVVLASEKYDREVIDAWVAAIETEFESKHMYVGLDLILARKIS